MAADTIVNRFGRLVGWNKVYFVFEGTKIEGITEIEYKDEVEVESFYGAGRLPVGFGQGQYKAEGSITLMLEERISLESSLPPGAKLQDIVWTAICSFEYQSVIYSDVLKECIFKNTGINIKAGDKNTTTKYDFLISEIDYQR